MMDREVMGREAVFQMIKDDDENRRSRSVSPGAEVKEMARRPSEQLASHLN